VTKIQALLHSKLALTCHFNSASLNLLYPDMLEIEPCLCHWKLNPVSVKKCEEVFETYTISTNMAEQIEEHT